MNWLLLLLAVLVVVKQTAAEPATQPDNLATAVNRDGRILVQDNYASIMSKLEQQEQQIAALKTQDSALNAEVVALKTQDSALNAEVAAMKTRENALKAEVASLKAQQVRGSEKVTFIAHLTQAINATPNQLIVFDGIRLNVGNAYRNGTFVAPYSGIYLLSVTICSQAGDYNSVDLLRNDTMIGSVNAGRKIDDVCATETTVTELTSGIDVVVKHRGVLGDYLPATKDLQSSFTGVLLY